MDKVGKSMQNFPILRVHNWSTLCHLATVSDILKMRFALSGTALRQPFTLRSQSNLTGRGNQNREAFFHSLRLVKQGCRYHADCRIRLASGMLRQCEAYF